MSNKSICKGCGAELTALTIAAPGVCHACASNPSFNPPKSKTDASNPKSNPRKPILSDFNLTERHYIAAKKLMSIFEGGNATGACISIGMVCGALFAFYILFTSTDVAIYQYVLIPLIGVGGGAGLGLFVLFIAFALICVPIRLLVGQFPSVKATSEYDRELARYHRQIKAEPIKKAIKEHEAKEATKRRMERQRLKDDWEKKVYSAIPEEYRFFHNGVLRIKGERLLDIVDWKQFESMLAHILRDQGWTTKLTNQGADGGIDIVGQKSALGHKRTVFVQAKHYRGTGRVGRPEIQNLVGAAFSEGCREAIIASSGGFTDQATSFVTGYRSSPQQSQLELRIWDKLEIQEFIDGLSNDRYLAMIEPMRNGLTDVLSN